jgi:hypothetical protein
MTLSAARPDDAVASAVVRAHAPPMSMSERLWNLDWRQVLPWQVGEVTIEHGTFDEIVPFLEANPRLFGGGEQRFFVEKLTDAKRRFWAEADVFILRRGGEMIGYWGGHPSDWSTYYCRTMAILPEHREGRIATELSTRICQTLAPTEVVRIEVDTSIANVAMQRMLLGLGFLVTSTSVSERWGTMLRFTKLLREEAGRIFKTQYVHAPDSGREPPHQRREP